MPISQFVVLVSYNFWVQLVHSDLPHNTGKKREEKGEKGKLERLRHETKRYHKKKQFEKTEKHRERTKTLALQSLFQKI